MNQPFIGAILMTGFDYAPEGWAECNGQILSINEYQALFSLIGITYGGDGRTTFALPDLREHSPIPELHFIIALQGQYPRRP